jgi:hypothetical protein
MYIIHHLLFSLYYAVRMKPATILCKAGALSPAGSFDSTLLIVILDGIRIGGLRLVGRFAGFIFFVGLDVFVFSHGSHLPRLWFPAFV